MVRKKKMQKKILFDSIVCYLTKKGNKKLARLLLQKALIKCSKKCHLGCKKILAYAFKKLYVSVEVRDVARRRKIFKVPFFISLNRQRYLAIKWFFNSVETNSNLGSYSDKISSELTNILYSKKAKSLLFRQQNIKLAVANRSNIHYRW